MQATRCRTHGRDKKQGIYNLFDAYVHTVPLEQLIESVELARRHAQLRCGDILAACSYCLGRAKRLDGSHLRTLALELKERLALTFAAIVISIVIQSNRRLDAEEAAEPPLRQIIELLQQVICAHDAEKLAISVLEIYEDGYHKKRCSK